MADRAAAGVGAPYGRSLVGRRALLDELLAAADRAAGGAGSLFLLEGEAGIGKTSVVRAVATGAIGLTASWGRCAADGSAPPFWPWRELIDASPTLLPAESAAPGGTTGAQRFELLDGLRGRILASATGRPSLHVIEDLQWADVASVLLLGHLAAGIDGAPLMIVATLRTGEALSGALSDAVEDIRRAARVIELAPLAAPDVELMMREGGGAPDPQLTALVLERTGGNPLFVDELLRAVATRDASGVDHPEIARQIPARISELVAHRQSRLPAPVAELLVTAAVLGHEGSTQVLAEAHGLGVPEVLELLEQGRAAHLLDEVGGGRWMFRHQIVRDAVYESASPARRAERHAQALEALARDPATPAAVLAAHALAALPLFDAERAVALAERAGEAALGQLAFEEAVRWFDHALAAAPPTTPHRWRAELLVRTGDAHRHLGETDAAREAFRAAADLVDEPALLAAAALGYTDPGFDLGIAFRSEDPMSRQLLERALAAQPEQDAATTVALGSRLAAELYFSEDPARAAEIDGRVTEWARALDDPLALTTAMALHHDAFEVGQLPLDQQLSGSEQLLVWARASGAPVALLTAHRARVFDLLAAGDVSGMEREIVAFRRLAEPMRVPAYQWWLALWSAMRALLDGRHDEAERLAVTAHQLGRRPFGPLALLNLSFLLFFLRREQGRLGELEEATRQFCASHADIPALRVGLTLLLAEIGRLDEAAGRLAAIDASELDRLRDRNWPAAWFQLARAARLANDRSLAGRLLEAELRPTERCVMVSLATVCLGAAELATGWLHHTVGDLDAAIACYQSAEDTNLRIGARSWLAQTRVDRARALLDRGGDGDRQAASSLLAQAAPVVESTGLAVVAADVQELRDRLDDASAAAAPPAAVASPPAAPAHGTFRRLADTWELDYAGRAARLPHARGLADLAVLLARPHEEISVLELVSAGVGSLAPSGLRGAPALDDQARHQIRARLRELDAEIDEAEAANDIERAALARERRQELAEAVARDLGLGGRTRRIGDDVERARKTVSTRIRRAIAQVERAHPPLARHLDRSIDTGAWCAYRPAEPVTWTT